jgi:HEAT repeat protein
MPLGAAAQEPTEVISSEARQFLDQIETGDPALRRRAFLQLEALREPATAPIVRHYLADRSAELRGLSVRALAAIEGLKAVPDLIERAQHDRHPYVRLQAMLAIEPFVGQEAAAVPVLINALRDRQPDVRMTAIDLVSRIRTSEARDALKVRWERERHRDVRRVLAAAMQRIGEL